MIQLWNYTCYFFQSTLPTFTHANKLLQWEEPLVHVLQSQLESLLIGILQKFVQPAVLAATIHDGTITSIDLHDKDNHVFDDKLEVVSTEKWIAGQCRVALIWEFQLSGILHASLSSVVQWHQYGLIARAVSKLPTTQRGGHSKEYKRKGPVLSQKILFELITFGATWEQWRHQAPTLSSLIRCSELLKLSWPYHTPTLVKREYSHLSKRTKHQVVIHWN